MPRQNLLPSLWHKSLLLLFVSTVLGLAFNALSREGIPLETPAQPSSTELIDWQLHLEGLRASLKDARDAFDRQEGVFADARSPAAYAAGHIPGALSLPYSQVLAEPAIIPEHLSRNTPIFTYCSGSACQSSVRLARILGEKYEFTVVRTFLGGFPAWAEAGYPVKMGELP